MIYFIFLSIFLNAAAQVLVKYGARGIQFDLSLKQIVPTIISMVKNMCIMGGLVLYGISFIVWVKVLSQAELSYAYPMVSIGYIIIMLLSYILFKENITPVRIVGVFFIIIGVIFVSRS